MVTGYDVPADKLIASIAKELAGMPEIAPPAWMKYAKSGSHRERSPRQADFWATRCASILRAAYVHDVVGVARLRTHYGGRVHRGVRPEHHRDAGGAIIRRALQQLEKAGLLSQSATGKKGRRLTAKGRALVDKVAKSIAK